MDKYSYLIIVFCSFLPLMIVFALTPYISRKGTCFGILLMEDMQRSSRIKKIKRGYSGAVSLIGIIFIFICVSFSSNNFLGIALVCYGAACLMLYFMCNNILNNIIMGQNLENLQKEINVHHIPIKAKKAGISSWWHLFNLPLLIFIWYISRNAISGYGIVLPILSIISGFVMLFIHLIIKTASHYANKKRFEKSMTHNIRFRRIWSVFVLFTGIIIQIMLIIMQFGFLGVITNRILTTAPPFVITLFVTVASVYIAIKNNKDA
ncbi:MAG: hypothetical protein M0R40_05980 [Firmicutes bacterium]|nr:hypothetical protein [Bacillota bacterium]